MTRTSLAARDTASSPDEAAVTGAEGPVDAAAEGTTGEDEERPFGTQPPTRFAADVEYRGRAGEHDYVVRVRHRLLDTSFTLVIDGVEHDPKAEEKARKAREKTGELDDDAAVEQREAADLADGEEPVADADADDAHADDAERAEDPADAGKADGSEHAEQAEGTADAGQVEDPADAGEAEDSERAADALQFGVEDGFSTLRCTVRRRREDGEIRDCEVVTIRTAGLGGAGEAEIRHGFRTTLLVPADGSASALRDEKRTAHPTRYALIAAMTKGAKFLIPLLGLGALFSGLLDPVEQWVEDRIRPAVEAIVQATQPIRDWIGEVTRPVREFLDALLSPLRELIAAILRPLGDALRWLLGLLPDVGLPFDVPDWLVDVLVPVLVVVAVFAATYSGLKRRREKLAETATGVDVGTVDGADAGTVDGADVETPDEADAEATSDAGAEAAGESGAESGDYCSESQEPSPWDARNDARSSGERSTQN